jgi:hypothetical protein
VVKDTKEWRATADLILAFIEDNLIFDKDHYVVAQDLYEHFVDYLRDQGHQTWAIQKFADRFGQHALVEGHHVVKQMIRSTYQGKLSRKTITHTTPIRFAAWLGVRYRTVEDDRENDQETSTSSNVGMDGMGGSVNAQDSHFARVNIGIHAIHANNGQDQDQDQNEALKSLAGRCGACGFHIATQGHAGDCTVGARQQAKDRASKIKKAVRDARRS